VSGQRARLSLSLALCVDGEVSAGRGEETRTPTPLLPAPSLALPFNCAVHLVTRLRARVKGEEGRGGGGLATPPYYDDTYNTYNTGGVLKARGDGPILPRAR
jgi:hypothetical protein